MKPPDKLYLQIDENFEDWCYATWCQDKTKDTDIEYVRVDLQPQVEGKESGA